MEEMNQQLPERQDVLFKDKATGTEFKLIDTGDDTQPFAAVVRGADGESKYHGYADLILDDEGSSESKYLLRIYERAKEHKGAVFGIASVVSGMAVGVMALRRHRKHSE